jgi:methylenetetrahydrofolate dehydrogenase (NADP+)/methenyltetrahydrofolate cyclohydrolase
LIEETKTDLSCLQGVIVGSQRFAEPLVSLLKKRGTKIKVIAPEDPSLKKETLEADLLISAVGHPGLITKDMVKPRAIVIDVGTTKVEQKITGDVAPDVEEVAGWMTPVPGGVGPMTVAMLLQNVLTASHLQTNTPE